MKSNPAFPPLKYRYNRWVFSFASIFVLACTVAIGLYLSPERTIWFYAKLALFILLCILFIYILMRGWIPALKKAPMLILDENGITDNYAKKFIAWTEIDKIGLKMYEGEITSYRLTIDVKAGSGSESKNERVEIDTTFLVGDSSDICESALQYCYFYTLSSELQAGRPL